MKLGLESKWKTGLLTALAAVFGYLAYSNFLAGPPAPSIAPPARAAGADSGAAPSLPAPAALGEAPRVPAAAGRNDGEFHPVLRSKRPEQQINPMTVDPTLHLELLAKLQEVSPEGGGRNLFQFSQPPPPPVVKAAKLAASEPIVQVQPPPKPPADQTPSVPPAPPPIPLKYYGLSTVRGNGKKTAFFLDGDEILMGGEGDVLKKRYRVVRIGVNSVVMEDTQNKGERTVPLEENASLPG
ncbi:MAG: hypothetical protein ABSC23_17360 [Bryobacteraceae bacterium]|jgi:hypothetical protein